MKIENKVLISVCDSDINQDGIFDKWNSVTSIGDGAFCNCTNLKSIIIPEGVTSIGNCAFYNCSSLKSITIPGSVISIGNCAFYNCKSLTSIIIPEGITSIGNCTFCNCTNLLYIKNNCLNNDYIFNDVTYKSLRIINGVYEYYDIPFNDIPFIK